MSLLCELPKKKKNKMLSYHCKKRKKNLYLIFVSRLFNLDIFLFCCIFSCIPSIDIFVPFVSLLPYTDYKLNKKTHVSVPHSCTYCFMLLLYNKKEKKEAIASQWHKIRGTMKLSCENLSF